MNISVSTVSRVVNNRDRVDPETREKILRALKEFNYQPDEIARSLRGNAVNVIGVIVPDIANTFFSMVIKGIESAARQNRYSVILCNSDADREREEECLQMLLQRKIAALIIASINGSSELMKQYFQLKIPVVFIDNIPKSEENYNSVTIDNFKAGYSLAKHLIELGHARIYTITGPLKETSAAERFNGWKKALAEAKINPGKGWMVEGDFKEDSGYRLMKEILKQRELPTAVFAANNFMAYGVVKAVCELGLRIPEDISVVTFDAVDITGLMKFQITSVIQPAGGIGKLAAEICIQEARNPDVRAYRKVVLEHELILGNSVKGIPAHV